MSRYLRVRQLNKNSFASTFLVEDRLHHGRFLNLKVYKSSPLLKHSKNPSLSIAENSSSELSLEPSISSDFLEILSKLTELRHPFCCRYYEVYVQSGIINVTTENPNPGRFDLLISECLRLNEFVDEQLVLKWIAQLLFGLIYLEQHSSIFLKRLPITSTALFNGNTPSAKLVDIEVSYQNNGKTHFLNPEYCYYCTEFHLLPILRVLCL